MQVTSHMYHTLLGVLWRRSKQKDGVQVKADALNLA